MTGLPLGGRLAVHSVGPTALPVEFSWRGRRHIVRRMDWLPGRARVGRYALLTMDGLRCIVTRDPDRSSWHLERVLPGGSGGFGG
jgi:hypothetical protein